MRRRLLAEPALGDTPEERYEALTTGGLRIYTTLDPAAQVAAEAAVASVLPDGGPSAALVAVDPRTGFVLALVGGDDYYDADDPVAQFNLATLGRRQPGSAFKPFALAAALQAGIGLDAEFQGGPLGGHPDRRRAAGGWRTTTSSPTPTSPCSRPPSSR